MAVGERIARSDGNRFESSQVVRESFGSGRIAVTQRVNSCYCVSARMDDSGGRAIKGAISQKKDAERRDKMRIQTGKTTKARQAA